MRGAVNGREAAGSAASMPLARSAVRLLEALAEPNASGFPDPIDTRRVLVRAGTDRRGVTLSAGAFDVADAEALVAGDLARWSKERRGKHLAVTEAGRAWLRRGAAAPADAFAAQHRRVALADRPDPVDGTARRVSVNGAESPLAWLASRRNRDGTPFLDSAAQEAGERLRRDLTTAGIMPGVTVDWSRFGGGGSAGRGPGGGLDMTEALVAARQRVARAGDALGGEDLDLLIDVCGFLKGLSTIERERGWPARSAKVLVARALKRLASHYGLAAEARGPARASGIGVWRA